MLVSGSTVSELPISSSKEMLNRSNGEVISITLSLKPTVEITLNLDK